MNNRFAGAVIIAVMLAIVIFGCRGNDITKKVLRTEKTVLSVLYACGLTNTDILSREEARWKISGLRGITVAYVFKAGNKFKAPDLADALRKKMRNIRGVHLERISYKGVPGASGDVSFEINYKKKQIFSAVIKGKSYQKPKKSSAKIVLVLDDFGYRTKNLKNLKNLNIPITMAVLPNAPYSESVCSFAEENGFEALLHLPLEPEKKTDYLEKDTITTDMTDESVETIIRNALRSVFCARGVSNHMGSKATGDARVMKIVMKELKKRNMFFLDSLTTEESVCESVALQMGVHSARRDIFIDNKADKSYVRKRMEECGQMAFEKGSAIAIGHDRAVTIEVLTEIVPELKERGISFTTLSNIIDTNNEIRTTKYER